MRGFPIYCFLLAEGAHYTHNPRKYALRLFIGALLSEPGFDFALFGGWTWENQSVMVTLLLGFGMVELMKKCPKYWMKLLAVVPFNLLKGVLVSVLTFFLYKRVERLFFRKKTAE